MTNDYPRTGQAQLAAASKNKELMSVDIKWYGSTVVSYATFVLLMTWGAQRHNVDIDSWDITRFYVNLYPEFRWFTLIADLWLIACLVLFSVAHATKTSPQLVWPLTLHYALAAVYHLLRAIYYLVFAIMGLLSDYSPDQTIEIPKNADASLLSTTVSTFVEYAPEMSIFNMFAIVVFSIIFCILSLLWILPLYTYQAFLKDINPESSTQNPA